MKAKARTPAKQRTPKPRRKKVDVQRIGAHVTMWCYGDKSGWRAKCGRCGWKDGDSSNGDYAWNVRERAEQHLKSCKRKAARTPKKKGRTWLRLAAMMYPNELHVFNDRPPSASNRKLLKDWGDSLFTVRITEIMTK